MWAGSLMGSVTVECQPADRRERASASPLSSSRGLHAPRRRYPPMFLPSNTCTHRSLMHPYPRGWMTIKYGTVRNTRIELSGTLNLPDCFSCWISISVLCSISKRHRLSRPNDAWPPGHGLTSEYDVQSTRRAEERNSDGEVARGEQNQ